MDGEDPPSDHKLCGYLRAVVAVNDSSPTPDRTQSLPSLPSHCHLSATTPLFTALNYTVLSPLDEFSQTLTAPNNSKRWSRMGMVHGSLSVVRLLHALVARNCLRIVSRVVRVEAREGQVRAVVLVDVYLPIALWSSGWQFPLSGSTAAVLFRHLSLKNMKMCIKDYLKKRKDKKA